MAPNPSRWAQLLVLAAVALSVAGAADGLTGSITAPQAGTWFADRTITVAGTASDPASDVFTLNATWGFAAPDADGAGLQNGTEVHLVPTGLTNWRFFEPFNYAVGTQAADLSDHFHQSNIGGGDRNWTVTNALASKMPGAPALGATEDPGNFSNELFWHVSVPRPISGVNVSFRYAVDDGARLLFYSSVTGHRFNYSLHMDSLFESDDPSSAAFDLSGRFGGQTSVFLRFTYARGANGTEWAAIDDLEVDISFVPQPGQQDETVTQDFGFGAVYPGREGLWSTGGGGWSSSNVLLHTATEETSAEARFVTASDIGGANLSFVLGCQNTGATPRNIRAEAAPSGSGPWTLLDSTNSTAAPSNFSADVTSLAGNRSLVLRVTAENSCYLDDLNLTLSADGDPADMPRGALIGDAIDAGRPVDWLGALYNASRPAGATAEFYLRWSDNGVSWSRWVRAVDGPPAPFATSRFVQPMAALSAPGWTQVPVVSDMSVLFSGIREVSVSVDAGATWEAMVLSYAPNASSVTWSGTVILEQGANDLQARALDTTGAAVASNVTVGWDTVAPPPPAVVAEPEEFVGSAALSWSWDPPVDVGLGVDVYAVRVGSLPGGGDLVPLLEVGGAINYTYSGAVDGGSYYFSVRARDLAGNWGPWGNASHGTTVDLTPPEAGVATRPSEFVNVTQVTWQWPPFADNGSGVAAYEVRLGTSNGSADASSGVVVTAPNYTFGGGVHGKRYYLTLRAMDRAGNWGPWGASSDPVAVDLVAPSAPGVPAGPSGFLNVTRASWQWGEAADYLSGVASYDVQVGSAPGGVEIFAGQTTGRSITLTSLPDGASIHVRVRALDRAGNHGSWSEPAGLLTVDRTGPAPVAGLAGPSGWINRTSATWRWVSGSDPVSGLAYHEVRVGTFPGGGDLLLDYRVPGSSYAFAALVESTPIYLSVRAVDGAGNRGDWSVSEAVRVDMAPPTVPGSINRTASPAGRATIGWSWEASQDSGSGVAGYLVRVGTTPATGDVYNWTPVDGTSFSFDSAQSGRQYFFSVRAFDAVGWGSRDRAAEGSVLVDLEAPEAPDLWAAALATREPSADVFWTLLPDPGGAGIDRFEVSYGPSGSPEETVTLSPYQYAYEIAGDDGQRITVRVRAADRAGNVGPWSPAVEVLFDRSPPTAPVDPVATVDGLTVTLNWGPSTDAGAGAVEYMVTVGTAPGLTDVVALALTNATSHAFPVEPGKSYYFTVSAVDGVGNELEEAVSGGPIEVPAVAPLELLAALAALALGSAGLVIAARRRSARAASVERDPAPGSGAAGEEE